MAADMAFPWSPDQGDGYCRNPVIYADYSDPDVIRVGPDYYLVASSFNCTPGLPILHSKDLVNWEIIGHALQQLPHPRYAAVQPGCGVWAPAMRLHFGRFWVYFAMPDEGIYVVTAGAASGPWSMPHLVQEGKGLIDPCPFWDDDGRAWLVHAYAGSRAGIRHRLRVRPMAEDGLSLLGEGEIVFHDPARHPILEGPKFLKRDGWYYISAPAGGVETGWQVVLRSKNILGPYEDKIVLATGTTEINGPHQGALVDTPEGRWWFAHFQDAGVYGRILHLQPVEWRDGWPLPGYANGNGCGEPVAYFEKPARSGRGMARTPQTTDEFAADRLGLQWQWHANHEADWFSLCARPGWLRLAARPIDSSDIGLVPNLLLQKFPARSFAVETKIDFSSLQAGDEAGLAVVGRASRALAVRRLGISVGLIFRADQQERALQTISGNEIILSVRVSDGGECEFGIVSDGEFTGVAEKFAAKAGVWIGAKTGIYCLNNARKSGGHADFDYFRFLAPG